MRTPSVGHGSQNLRFVVAAILATGAWVSPSLAEVPMLEEIVVTAEKRGAQSVMDTTFSILAVNGELLEERGISSFRDAVALAPGVSTFQLGGGTNLIQIRGVSSLNGDATVGYYLDDLPFTLVDFQLMPELNPYDLERMEVLRGPQGTLYGASSMGGTVRLITQSPQHGSFNGKATVGIATTDGGENSWKAQGALNLPLVGEVLSARIVGARNESGGYVRLPLAGEKDFNDATSETLRGRLRWTPTDSLDIGLSYWKTKKLDHYNNAEEDFTWSPAYLEFDPATGDVAGIRPVPGRDLETRNEFDLYNLNLDYTFGDFRLYSTSSYIKAEQDLPQNYFGVPLSQTANTKTFNQEVRLGFDSGATWSWTLGAFYSDSETKTEAEAGTVLAGFEDPIMTNIADQVGSSEQWAVFGEATYRMGSAWSLTAGARYFADDRQIENRSPSILPLLALAGIPAVRSDEFSKLTGRINLSYAPDDSSLYYLNVAQGFRSGASQSGVALATAALVGVSDVPFFAGEESLTSYELGGKWTLLGGSLQIETAIYLSQWDDIITQIAVFSPVTNTPVTFLDNVGSADAIGLDVSLAWRITDSLTWQLSANVNESEYGEDLPAAGIAKGDQVQLVPKSTMYTSLDYQRDLGTFELVAQISYQRIDERLDYAAGGIIGLSDSVDFLGARLGVRRGRLGVFLTGENLLNDDGAVNQFAQFVTLGVPPVRPRPMTIGLEATVGF